MKGRKTKLNKSIIIPSLLVLVGLALGFLAYSAGAPFAEIKNVSLKPISQVQAQTTSLYLTDINITSLTSTSVNITWQTNLFADSKVEIGETSSYEMTAACTTCHNSSLVRTHNITVGALEAGKTYHYRVVSAAETGETRTSLDRTFTTPTTTSDTTAPSITYLAAEVTGTDASLIVHTSEDTHVTIYYSLDPIVDLTAPGVSSVNDNALPFRVVHTLNISGLALNDTYYYRVRAVDPSNNSFTSGEFTFNTGGAGDYTFTTGVCPGGVPIGACTEDQYYCDVGTAALIHNCEHCGYQCPAGQTCLPGGVCTSDPTLTDDPYQCNREECYKSCQGITPAQSCNTDSDCPGVPCVDDGVFNSPAPANCFSTYPRCDANVILKVKRDRECDKWLECGTALEQTDRKTGQVEEICMDLSVCTGMGAGNQCISYANLPQQEVTFRTPDQIESIKWLTGAITAGLDWAYQQGSPVIQGYYPWSAMEEVGEKLRIENSDFESTYLSDQPVSREGNVLGGRGDVYVPQYKPGTAWFKYPNNDDNDIKLAVEWNLKSQKDNHVLMVSNMNDLNQGVSTKIESTTGTQSYYILNLKIKSSTAETQKVTVRLNSGGQQQTTSVFGEYALTSGWQEIFSQPITGVGGEDTYVDIFVSEGSIEPFYIDDIEIKPALEVQSGTYLKRSCRLYPKDDSPKCEYYDDNGIFNKGWWGYCLERDPKNKNICISWWPVDLLYGESNLFGDEEQAGYSGRSPLYYCLESRGRSEYNGTQNARAFCEESGADGTDCEQGVEDRINNVNYTFAVCDWGGGCNLNSRARVSCNGQYWAYSELDSDDLNYRLWEDEIYYAHAYQTYDFGGHIDSWDWWGDEMRSDFRRNIDGGFIQRQLISFRPSGFFEPCQGYIMWRMRWAPAGLDMVDAGMLFECINADGSVKNCNNLNERGRLKAFVVIGDDRTGDDVEGAAWELEIYKRELCSRVVQVAETGGVEMAWADKLNMSAYQVEGLEYSLNTDLSPYGGAVTRDSGPTDWNSPLYAEAPNTADWATSPYQVRSGSPYACQDLCSAKVCSGGPNEGEYCSTHADCLSTTTAPDGICTGVGTCSITKKPCNSTRTQGIDCPAGKSCCPEGEECLGGAANERGTQLATNWPANSSGACSGSGASCLDHADCPVGQWCVDEYYAEQRIRRLFARSYGLWSWDWRTGDYSLLPESDDPLNLFSGNDRWGPPNVRCPNDTRPPEDYINNTDYCGIPPKIRNIKLGDGRSNIAKLGPDGGKIRLSFNIIANREQQPVNTIYIDWGDGEVVPIPYIAKSKDDPANPHVYTHKYENCLSGDCQFHIRIMAEDNWGWCSASPGEGLQYARTCVSGPDIGGPCYSDNDCTAGSCGNVQFTCGGIKKIFWDPVTSCSGGSCVDGACSGGVDDGRPCGDLIVDLSD